MSSAPDGVTVHPAGLCDSPDVGEGTRIWAFAHVLAGAVVGRRCNIGESSFVEGGAVLGDGVTVKNGVQVWDLVHVGDGCFLGPNATFTNDLRPRAFLKKGPGGLIGTTLERGVTIGANATIVCGTRLGEFAFVAAGAVVTRDVVPHSLVAGNPAVHRTFVCRCAAPLSDPADGDVRCDSCGRRYVGVQRNGLAAIEQVDVPDEEWP